MLSVDGEEGENEPVMFLLDIFFKVLSPCFNERWDFAAEREVNFLRLRSYVEKSPEICLTSVSLFEHSVVNYVAVESSFSFCFFMSLYEGKTQDISEITSAVIRRNIGAVSLCLCSWERTSYKMRESTCGYICGRDHELEKETTKRKKLDYKHEKKVTC